MPLGSWACHVGHSNVWVISDWSRWFVADMHDELCLARSDASPGVTPHQELDALVRVMPQQEL